MDSQTAQSKLEEAVLNRRVAKRTEACIPTVVVDKNTMSYSTITDFSDTGLRLNIPYPLAPDDEVELLIKPKNDPLAKPVHVKLTVKHCREENPQNFSIGGQLKYCFDGLKMLLQTYSQKQPGSSLKDRLGFILA
ncbi:PilZ domain-containing protein [Thiomicrorhabdus xiamenensis]|uniref:PilZ domain-containing protein n=1 Tax=Thiomicrorhabdus xiamenensis TaxID=2739063 RepID=A0A7D4SYV4_9GAMM|nr:PilZ domain-containing protein [Thiomicrorhabdus xiamenensis]QKI88202.1 PilZ domain-containing protein [Thiomicrorhabdus xiamenensis]